MSMNLKDHIAPIPCFPKSGNLFYKISQILGHSAAWQSCVNRLAEYVAPHAPDVPISIKSRKIFVTAPVAIKIYCEFIMAQKSGKVPDPTVAHMYDLEYRTDTVEIRASVIKPGQRVVILDDLFETGRTMVAAINFTQKLGGVVRDTIYIIKLAFLGEPKKLSVPFDAWRVYQD